jgi:3-deoxy-D-manno-octulosonic-acid transferase
VNLLDLLYIPIGVLTAPLWMRKKRDGWDQRFGHVASMLNEPSPDAAGSAHPRVLLHAVSVGEVNALRSLVPMLLEDANVVISVTTDTGLKQARSLFGDLERCEVVRYPLDCSWMVDRFLELVQPDVVGLVELEIWPNFVKRCVKRGIPIGIINGRLSARSFKGYRKAKLFLRPTFARLSFACVQDQHYADRIFAMGTPIHRVEITGSMKWDSVDASVHSEPSAKAHEIADSMGVDLDRPVIVAGSTGPGEEAMLHNAIPADVQLIVAPRKIERFEEAASAIPGSIQRSSGKRAVGEKRFVLDTIGELSAIYEIADVVIIGRSFFDLYGSDPIEPAARGKPVLIGPAHSDFLQAMEVLSQADAIQIVARHEVGGAVAKLLDSSQERHAIGQRAREAVTGQQGASQRHKQVLLDHLHPTTHP